MLPSRVEQALSEHDDGQQLVAHMLGFDHPCPEKGRVTFESPLPDSFCSVLRALGRAQQCHASHSGRLDKELDALATPRQ